MTSLITKKIYPRLKKILTWSIAIVAILVITGIIYQLIGETNDRKGFPAPGKMISVGDHQLHIQIKGTGSPVVILEAASDGTSANWAWIMDEISKVTTVCAYDRAGHGWSEESNDPRDAVHIAEELHRLLSKTNLAGPYILVGHSAGGLFVRAYQEQYPADVAGMVLVDADNEKEITQLPGFIGQLNSDKQFAKNMSMLSVIGIPRLIFSIKEPAPDLPVLQGKQIKSFWSSGKHWKSLSRELGARLETNRQVAAGRTQLTIPLEIISAGKQSPQWLALQNDLESLSINSRHIIVQNADHLSLVLKKENTQETIAALVRIIESLRPD